MSILLVDDDDEYLCYMGTVLTGLGYQPQTACSGTAALGAIEEKEFSLVITDLRMPEVSGMDLIKVLRQKHPLTVSIAMTAFSSADSAMEALRLGAFDYLLKPSGLDAIKVAVVRGLEHHGLHKELIAKTNQLKRFQSDNHEALDLIQQVSHKMRNPLGVVFGCASILMEKDLKAWDPQEMSASVKLLHDNVERMCRILDQFSNEAEELPRKPRAFVWGD